MTLEENGQIVNGMRERNKLVSNFIIAMRKSVVMLFSFALIATFLTILNVGLNESGNAAALSTITEAQAGINLEDSSSSGPIPITIAASCLPTCNKTTGVGKKVYPTDDTIKGVIQPCSSRDGSGNCIIAGNILQQERSVKIGYCQMSLFESGRIVAVTGPTAARYVQNTIGPVFDPANDSERMFMKLTGYVPWSYNVPHLANGNFMAAWGYRPGGEYQIGAYSWRCNTVYRLDQFSKFRGGTTCAPKTDGRPFPYSTGLYIQYKNRDISYVDNHQNRDWNLTSTSCVYVSSITPPPKVLQQTVKCYWNIKHTGWYSTNRAAINSGGAPTTNAPDVSAINKGTQPYLVGANSTRNLVGCETNFSMKANLELTDGHAYYRLQGTANYQTFQFYIWDTAYTQGRQLRADIKTIGGVGTEMRKVFGTHRCDVTPAWTQYNTYGSLPTVNFKASVCAKTVLKNYQCVIPHNPRINGVDNDVQVMRDGSYLPVNLGGAIVSGSGVRDTYSRNVGTVNDKNMSYMVKVQPNSSPLNGTNMNDEKQYFELWKNNKSAETKWSSWMSEPNTNRTSYLTFYWSSDNSSSWKMTYQAKLNSADFAVKFQDRTDSPTYDKWITETNVDCDGVKTSNAATVLRSVSSEG